MENFLIVASMLITGFTQKWLLPNGTFGCQNRICIGDTDKDGNFECIFRPRSYGHHYGYI